MGIALGALGAVVVKPPSRSPSPSPSHCVLPLWQNAMARARAKGLGLGIFLLPYTRTCACACPYFHKGIRLHVFCIFKYRDHGVNASNFHIWPG